MNILKDEYIIVEIIPTSLDPKRGNIIEMSALKLKGLKLQDRFNYRLEEELVFPKEFLKLTSYDKDKFTYLKSTKAILKEFATWSNNLPLLIIDNDYTEKYLQNLTNKKESIFKYLDTKYNDNIIDELKNKYHIEDTNYIVDILYESLIKHF